MNLDRSRNLSRRELLASGLAAAGALALGGRRSALASIAPAGDYGPFKMGLQSYSLRHYKAAEALAKTQALGVHYWEAYSAHTPPDVAKAAESKALAASSGVEVIGFGVSNFSKDVDKSRKLFEFGKAIGVEYLSADPDPDSFDTLDKLVEEYGIAIGIHPHGPVGGGRMHRWAKIDTINAAIKDHSPKIGICLDTGHILRANEDPLKAVEVFGKRVYGVHLKDVKGGKTFTILGEGDLNLSGLLAMLAKNDYKYCLALEYEENEKDPIADIAKCLEATRKAIATIKPA